MPLDNEISVSFTAQESADLDAAMETIERILEGKVVSLTPKQSKLYGKLGNETENFTKMIRDDLKAGADLKPDFVDDVEWDKDIAARGVLLPRATRMAAISQKMTDTARLLGSDIYQSTLSVYNNSKFLASRNQGGAKTYYEKWSVQYPGGKRTGVTAAAAAKKDDANG